MGCMFEWMAHENWSSGRRAREMARSSTNQTSTTFSTPVTTIVPSPSIAMPVAIPGATTEPIGLSCVSSETLSERSSASATV